jgi:hypothetical protein
VKSEKHPDTKDLERLKDYHKVPVGTKEEMLALNLKYDAMVYQPTAIEKTMTPAIICWRVGRIPVRESSISWTEKVGDYHTI